MHHFYDYIVLFGLGILPMERDRGFDVYWVELNLSISTAIYIHGLYNVSVDSTVYSTDNYERAVPVVAQNVTQTGCDMDLGSGSARTALTTKVSNSRKLGAG